jgi:hypothetical protein
MQRVSLDAPEVRSYDVAALTLCGLFWLPLSEVGAWCI